MTKDFEDNKVQLVQQLAEFRGKCAELTHERDDLKAALKQAQEKADSASQFQVASGNSVLLEQIDALKEDNEQLHEQLKHLQSQNSVSSNLGAETQANELKAKLAALEDELETSQTETERANAKKEELRQQLSDMTKELTALKTTSQVRHQSGEFVGGDC